MTIDIKGYQVLIDDEDYEKVNKYKWRISSKHKGLYFEAGKSKNYPKRIYLHRLLIDCHNGFISDHKDGNHLNCKKENLRIATYAQNRKNSRKKITNASGFKGVSWDKINNKWRASIGINYKVKHLGFFISKELAYKAYCEAAKKYYGEFARFE